MLPKGDRVWCNDRATVIQYIRFDSCCKLNSPHVAASGSRGGARSTGAETCQRYVSTVPAARLYLAAIRLYGALLKKISRRDVYVVPKLVRLVRYTKKPEN